MKGLGLAICSLFIYSSQAQVNLTAQVKGGFLIPHHNTMRSLMNHAQCVELSALYKIDSNHTASKNLKSPSIGFVAGFIRNNNQQTNGNMAYLGAMAEKNFLLTTKHRLAVSFATGFGYLNKRFDEETNRQNIAIGSHVNGLMQVGLKHYWKLGKQTEFISSLDLTHFSNGNLRMPNLGFNYPFLGLGINSAIGNRTLKPNIHEGWNSKLLWEGGVNYGRRQISIDDRTNINMASLALNLVYPQSEIARWKVGFNMFYDRSYVHTDLQSLPKGRGLNETSEIALVGGHEYRMGKVGFTTELGLYLFRPNDKKRIYYEALGLRYYPRTNLYVGTRLKAHLTSADYFEFGIGYQFRSKKNVKPGFKNGWRWVYNTLTFQ